MICAVVLVMAFTGLAWPGIRESIPPRPRVRSGIFRLALGLEVVAALYTLFVHAPFHAESPATASAVALAVLVFIGLQCRKLRGHAPSKG